MIQQKNRTYNIRGVVLIIIALIFSTTNICATKKHALLIGISEYPVYSDIPQSSWQSIHGTNDIKLITNVLKNQGFSVQKILNKQATAAKIRKSLKQLIQKVTHGDIVYVHFSGHGQSYEDISGDEADGWDEAIVPYDARSIYIEGVYEGTNHILDDELEIYFTAIRKKIGEQGFLYVVLDACHMGGASRGNEVDDDEIFVRGSYKGFSPNKKRYIPKIDKRGNMLVSQASGQSGICVLEACRSYQTNAEIKQNGTYYGPLSYYINQTLKSTSLTTNTDWIETVRKAMNADKRLTRQNMVVEQSNI
jgi:translation initiation factor IF-1